MKIVSKTYQSLVVEHTPWIMGIAIIAVGLLVIGSGLNDLIAGSGGRGLLVALIGAGAMTGCLLGFIRRSQLILDRPANSVTLRRRSFLRFSEEARPLDDLVGAEVVFSDGGSKTKRVELKFRSHDPLPLTLVYASDGPHEQIARTINDWM